MAFDQTTRNRLQRFVSDARGLLEVEFVRQMQADFGLDPDAGTVTPLENLTHLDDAKRETARILRATLDHYRSSEGTDRKAGLDRIVREQAFTVLNRLAAFRMAEARGLLVESVGNGLQARGFQLYSRLAGTGLGEMGDSYRTYLLSVFDELARDLRGLFDRFSPQGRLFPRETTLLGVIDLINDPEIDPLWSEDETIGWIYQYFNSKEERKAMRDASQAPRNSRELAVRNQFFTPRYVVEFLVDNTLGRLWFDATRGETSLRDRCQYLLVKPDEAPVAETKLRDPRTLKLLDPACGSMHFGLYAFDLFEVIYREAWDWEATHGPGSLDVSTQPLAGFGPLSQAYSDVESFLRDVPRLIVERNIHGVDIDPRAVQIASLALWLRAQRSWHEEGVRAVDRPAIGRGRVVAAVAPPVEEDLRRQFTARLDSRDEELFRKTIELLDGLPELGVLLQIERELPRLIRKVYGETGALFKKSDELQWAQAESRLREGLTDFALAGKSTYQGRLFAQDALQGLEMIDLCREVFDVVVMNPPFGEAALGASEYLKSAYVNSKQDIFQCFVDRALRMTRKAGMVGVLSARTGFFMGDSESWRTEVLWQNSLTNFVDLGLGVLDDALVEAAAYVIVSGQKAVGEIAASRHLATRDKESGLREAVRSFREGGSPNQDVFQVSQDIVSSTPGGVFAYWAPESFLARFSQAESFAENVGRVRQGLATADDFRFVRLAWEVPPDLIGSERRWNRFSKGGEYSPPYDDIHLVVDWEGGGRQLKAFSRAFIRNERFYHHSGATYTVRTASAFAAKVLPRGCVFSHNAQSWFLEDRDLLMKSVVYFGARVPQAYLELAVGGGDVATSGSAARRYTTKVVHSIPSSVLKSLDYEGFDEDCRALLRVVASGQSHDETTCLFAGYPLAGYESLRALAAGMASARQSLITKALEASWRIDQAVTQAWSLTASEIRFVRQEIGPHPCEYGDVGSTKVIQKLMSLPTTKLVARGVKKEGAARWLTKKSYFVDRSTELTCHIERCPPEVVERAQATAVTDAEGQAARLVAFAVGVAFGRWSSEPLDTSATEFFINDPFRELPPNQPASNTSHAPRLFLVGELAHKDSITRAVEQALRQLWPNCEGPEQELSEALGGDLDEYLRTRFFSDHISTYSKSRRKAPIYWPLTTASGNFTVWLYYPALSRESLFTVANDYVEPTIAEIARELRDLRNAGASRSRNDEERLELLQNLDLELREFLESLLRLASSYYPNQNDGVRITASPLWAMIHHKSWQSDLKATWVNLEKGKHDWAHLAMAYWPDRVRKKSESDKSLAIAHGLEELYVEAQKSPSKGKE